MKSSTVVLLIVLLIISIVFFSCSPEKSPSVVVSTEALDRHLGQLASDDFMGRMPFTAGETKTINYLKEVFEELGLEPANEGSYFQEVAMVEITPVVEEEMEIEGSNDQELELEYLNDFVVTTLRLEDEIEIDDSELVFCGFGVVAPEYGWNDYEGIDMKGKTAVVLVNDPGFGSGDSTFFKGDVMTYYGRWTYKYEEAARQGAEGAIIIHETVPAGYPWLVVRNGWSGASLTIEQEPGNASRCAMEAWISREAAGNIFKMSTAEITNYKEMASQKGFKPIPLGLTVEAEFKNQIKHDVSRNVMAYLPGSERPDEYIIYSAHWDHFGVGITADGDSIYNGAMDDGTGTAAVLAIAEAFTQLPSPPKRSVAFLLVTGEEQGLLGSAYYGANPLVPHGQTVANINMDVLYPYGPMKDLTIIGIGQSELEEYASAEAARQGRYVMPDPDAEKGFYFRSDHFSFAKVGIPALYAKGAYEHMEKGVDYIKELKQIWNTRQYHRPSDEYDPSTWDLSGIQQDAQLNFNIGYRIANESTWPQWYEGSEFRKGVRGKQ